MIINRYGLVWCECGLKHNKRINKMDNSLKEQKGLEILDLDNLETFIRECLELPESFKRAYIPENKNGLTCLILKVLDETPELIKFEHTAKIKDGAYFETLRLTFCKFLGFDDDDHFAEWLGENPQWAQESWCGWSTDIFNNSQNQGFVSANSTSTIFEIRRRFPFHF
jgi:hypothetical protein